MTYESFNATGDGSQLTAEAVYEQRHAIHRQLAIREASGEVKWTIAFLLMFSLAAFLVSWYRLAIEWSVGSWWSGCLYMGVYSSAFVAFVWSLTLAVRHGRSIGFTAAVPAILAIGMIIAWAKAPYENGFLRIYPLGNQHDYDEVVRLAQTGKFKPDKDGYTMLPGRFSKLSYTGSIEIRTNQGRKALDFTLDGRSPQLHYVFCPTGEFIGPDSDSSPYYVSTVMRRRGNWFLAVYSGWGDWD